MKTAARGSAAPSSDPPEPLSFPFEALPPISAAGLEAIKEHALRVNHRYLIEFIEEYAFCPFSREGRRKGQTTRYVYYIDRLEAAPLIELMHQIAADPKQAVAQVIFPIIEVAPLDWVNFCTELTAAAHALLPGRDVLALAALHPGLAFKTLNPFSLIPLFRRAPDPTIQWVRLDALEAIYEGRKKGTTFVSLADVPKLVAAGRPKKPLYDRVAETNQSMARRLGIDKVVELLAEIHDDGRRSYARILAETIID